VLDVFIREVVANVTTGQDNTLSRRVACRAALSNFSIRG
jgi:hypothetical protein